MKPPRPIRSAASWAISSERSPSTRTAPSTPPTEQETLYLQKHTLTSGEQTITVTVDEEPARAGVDPYVTLVDRNTDDNVTDVTRGEEDG